ncbi:MAG: MerR family transcriptional regulator [Acidobacteriota bacterium]
MEETVSLTLEELSNEVTRLLTMHGLLGTQQDGRVSAAPDIRTIRYYTTLGLLDRPKMIGRQAQYGRRHLLQLLAIKALQGRSMPLAEIQAKLYGCSDVELEALLAAVSQEQTQQSEIRPLYWREITIEPGLKLLAEESWSSKLDQAALEERIRAALVTLKASSRRNGGKEDGNSN